MISPSPRRRPPKGSNGRPTSRTADLLCRLAQLEATVARMQQGVQASSEGSGASRPWWRELAGRFDGDPIFAEVVREGRRWRQAQRPRPPKTPGRSGPKQ
jgi:hypothetical protein